MSTREVGFARARSRLLRRLVALAVLLPGCTAPKVEVAPDGGMPVVEDTGTPPISGPRWQRVFTGLPAAFTAVWGASESDVWAVGTDLHDVHGPLVLHYDGTRWVRRKAQEQGELWAVHGISGGPAFFGASGGVVLRFEGGRFATEPTPVTKAPVLGVWVSSPDDVWAVGGFPASSTGGFVWRLTGGRFVPQTVPVQTDEVFTSVWGTAPDDVYVAGSHGTLLHFDGNRFQVVTAGVGEVLNALHAVPSGMRRAAAGGDGAGVLVESEGSSAWATATLPPDTPPLRGVWLTDLGGYAVGERGAVLARAPSGWTKVDTNLSLEESLRAVWVDPVSGAWIVGGNTTAGASDSGTLIHLGETLPSSYLLEEMLVDGGVDAGDGGADSAAAPDSGARDASPGDGAVRSDGAP